MFFFLLVQPNAVNMAVPSEGKWFCVDPAHIVSIVSIRNVGFWGFRHGPSLSQVFVSI